MKAICFLLLLGLVMGSPRHRKSKEISSIKLFNKLPLFEMLKLTRLAEDDDGLRFIDLEAGGSMMQSTQFELDIHRSLFALILDSKPKFPKEGHDVLSKLPSPDDEFAQRKFNRWLSPLEASDGGCLTCINSLTELTSLQFFVDHIPPIQLMGEAMEQYQTLKNLVGKEKVKVETLTNAVVSLVTASGSTGSDKVLRYARDVVKRLVADKDGHSALEVLPCHYIRGVLREKNLLATPDQRRILDTIESLTSYLNNLRDPALRDKTNLVAAMLIASFNIDPKKSGAPIRLDECEEELLKGVLAYKGMSWPMKEFWDDSMSYTQQSFDQKRITFRNFERILKTAELGAMTRKSLTAPGQTYDLERFVTGFSPAPSVGFEGHPHRELIQQLFDRISGGNAVITPNEISKFIQTTMSLKDHDETAKQIFQDFHPAAEGQLTFEAFFRGLNLFPTLVDSVPDDEIRKALPRISPEAPTSLDQPSFLKFMSLLFSYGTDAPAHLTFSSYVDSKVPLKVPVPPPPPPSSSVILLHNNPSSVDPALLPSISASPEPAPSASGETKANAISPIPGGGERFDVQQPFNFGDQSFPAAFGGHALPPLGRTTVGSAPGPMYPSYMPQQFIGYPPIMGNGGQMYNPYYHPYGIPGMPPYQPISPAQSTVLSSAGLIDRIKSLATIQEVTHEKAFSIDLKDAHIAIAKMRMLARKDASASKTKLDQIVQECEILIRSNTQILGSESKVHKFLVLPNNPTSIPLDSTVWNMIISKVEELRNQAAEMAWIVTDLGDGFDEFKVSSEGKAWIEKAAAMLYLPESRKPSIPILLANIKPLNPSRNLEQSSKRRKSTTRTTTKHHSKDLEQFVPDRNRKGAKDPRRSHHNVSK